MKKMKLAIAACLTVVAAGGAFASVNTQESYWYYPENDPLNTPQPITRSYDCPVFDSGCFTDVIGEEAPVQLYKQTETGLQKVAPEL